MPLQTLERLAWSEQAPVEAGDESDVVLAALQEQWNLPAVGPLERLANSLNQEFVGESFTQEQLASEVITGYVRPPESEIYGRSLSTIRRLGTFMMKALAEREIIDSPEADQAKAEFFTSVEEGFGTDMELGETLEVRDFTEYPIVDGRVMSRDRKTAISDMTAAGLVCARETAQKDQRFLPQLTRSEWDHENALIVDKMARGETGYNTRIVISPFPEEAAAQSGDEYWRGIGYVPSVRRGFVQLYHVSEGKVIGGSLSFDGSNKQELRRLFKQLGKEIPVAEITDNWLRYAFTVTLSEDDAKATGIGIADKVGVRHNKSTNTVDVTKQHRPIMERVFNESYIHCCESLVRGHQTAGARELILQLANRAHDFNERYARALYGMRANPNQFTDDDMVVLHELLVYSTIEMMRALHLKTTALLRNPTEEGRDDIRLLTTHLQSTDSLLFQDMLGGFGADGARNNRTYSACGLSISLGEETAEDSPQSVFGGYDKTIESEDNIGSRWFSCPKGHLNYRRVANIKETNCIMCGVDVSCESPKASRRAKIAQKIRTLFSSKQKASEHVGAKHGQR